jgi:hypothetical protein
MATRNWVFVTLVLATAILASGGRSLANPPGTGIRARRLADSVPPRTPLADDIQRFVWELRFDALRRWFADDSFEPFDTDWFGWDEDVPDEAWWDDTFRAMQESTVARSSATARSAVPARASGKAIAVASGEGAAISMARVDDHYEIEAAHGKQRFHIRGTREEVQQWVTQLPSPLREAVESRLGIGSPDECLP